MQLELEAWRQARSARKSKAEHGLRQQRSPACASKENALPRGARLHRRVGECGPPSTTPVKGSPHVNAVSPLTEVCQNSGLLLGSARSTPEPARQSVDVDPVCTAGTAPAVTSMLAAWEDQVRLPVVPPTSPAPELSACRRRPGFCPHTLAAALSLLLDRGDAVPASPEQQVEQQVEPRVVTAPLERAAPRQKAVLRPQCLLERLEQAQAEAAEEVTDGDGRELATADEGGELAGEPEADDGAAEEDRDAYSSWRRRLERHEISWPKPTTLEMEDHLNRAYDIVLFWFFEMRDRTNNALQEALEGAGPLECVHEYPLDWPQWRIHSFEFREAARADRAGARQRIQLARRDPAAAADDGQFRVCVDRDPSDAAAGSNSTEP